MLVGGMYLVMTIALSTLVGFFERRVRGLDKWIKPKTS